MWKNNTIKKSAFNHAGNSAYYFCGHMGKYYLSAYYFCGHMGKYYLSINWLIIQEKNHIIWLSTLICKISKILSFTYQCEAIPAIWPPDDL